MGSRQSTPTSKDFRTRWKAVKEVLHAWWGFPDTSHDPVVTFSRVRLKFYCRAQKDEPNSEYNKKKSLGPRH